MAAKKGTSQPAKEPETPTSTSPSKPTSTTGNTGGKPNAPTQKPESGPLDNNWNSGTTLLQYIACHYRLKKEYILFF